MTDNPALDALEALETLAMVSSTKPEHPYKIQQIAETIRTANCLYVADEGEG